MTAVPGRSPWRRTQSCSSALGLGLSVFCSAAHSNTFFFFLISVIFFLLIYLVDAVNICLKIEPVYFAGNMWQHFISI